LSGICGDLSPAEAQEIKSTVTFKKWFCGHFHEDMDIDNFRFLYQKIVNIEE
jgi:hypothetical protein